MDLLAGMFPTARDKRGQPVTAGGLSERLVAQVETPAHAIAHVAQRGVHREPVHEQCAAAFISNGSPFAPRMTSGMRRAVRRRRPAHRQRYRNLDPRAPDERCRGASDRDASAASVWTM